MNRLTLTAWRPLVPVMLLISVTLVISLAGCGLAASEPTLSTVTDPGGVFHFKAPEDWQKTVETGLIAVYAAEELPESGSLESLSMLVLYGTTEDTQTPVADKVVEIVELRAESRGWSDYSVGEPQPVSVGSKTGTRVAVSGADADGNAFEGAYHLVRTGTTEVLIIAVTPEGQWSEDQASVDSIFEQWFWLRPEAVE